MRDPDLALEELAHLLYLEPLNRCQVGEDLIHDLGVHICHFGRDTTHPIVCTIKKIKTNRCSYLFSMFRMRYRLMCLTRRCRRRAIKSSLI